jgi:hypothetical protein
VAVRRADEIAEQHAGELDVVDKAALALGEAHVLDALSAGAEAFELLRAGGRGFDCGCRFGAHWVASLAPRSTSAAARIALTMF